MNASISGKFSGYQSTGCVSTTSTIDRGPTGLRTTATSATPSAETGKLLLSQLRHVQSRPEPSPGQLLKLGASCWLSEPVCRTLVKINPEYPAIYETVAAWVRRFLPFSDVSEMSRMLENRYPMWDSMVYATGIGQRVAHSACFTALMFEVDDVALLQHVLFGDINADWVAGHPYGPAFSDILTTDKCHMSDGVYRRYVKAWQDWFAGTLEENQFRSHHEVPNVETYLDVRRRSVGLLPNLPCAEYVHNIDLSEFLAQDSNLVKAGLVAVDHAMLVNDLFSFRREYFGQDYINIISSLLHTHRYSLQEAVDITCEMIRQADAELARLCEVLRLQYALFPQVNIYLDTLNTFCAGNLRWSLETPRYIGHGVGWNGLRSGVLTFHADRTSLEQFGSYGCDRSA
ncbi:terpene synthase [Nocardia terpenica]|uniref:terpene synthase family protein n=1 Tax=Nocardia terpenica TaxID=455432 RepID=UPI002FE2448B